MVTNFNYQFKIKKIDKEFTVDNFNRIDYMLVGILLLFLSLISYYCAHLLFKKIRKHYGKKNIINYKEELKNFEELSRNLRNRNFKNLLL